jgi:hypothetical protein
MGRKKLYVVIMNKLIATFDIVFSAPGGFDTIGNTSGSPLSFSVCLFLCLSLSVSLSLSVCLSLSLSLYFILKQPKSTKLFVLHIFQGHKRSLLEFQSKPLSLFLSFSVSFSVSLFLCLFLSLSVSQVYHLIVSDSCVQSVSRNCFSFSFPLKRTFTLCTLSFCVGITSCRRLSCWVTQSISSLSLRKRKRHSVTPHLHLRSRVSLRPIRQWERTPFTASSFCGRFSLRPNLCSRK